jgi:subtilisin family serine protease
LRRGIFACAPGGVIPTIPGVSTVAASIALAAGPPSTNQTPPAETNPPPTPSPAANLLPPFVPDQVLVSLPTASQETVEDDVAQTFGLELVNRWPLDLIGARLVLYRIPDGRPVATVVAALQADGRITGPQPNYYYTQQAEAEASEEAGPSLDLQYALNKLEIGPAHRIATGNGVTIAVIDTQIDTTHPDLAGAVQETFDATGAKTVTADNHGTAIAGIISAHGTLKGVAPGSALLGINAFMPTGRNVAATTATLLRGLDWAARKKATIVNLSLSGPRDDLMRRGVEAAIGGGIVVVAAAGNGGEKAAPAYPAAYDGVIAVTAIDIGDRLYAEANRGNYIAIAAPGVDVLTPALDHAHLLQSGTSFAAAHVSAIIALMVERDPSLTLDDIRAALAAAAKDLGSPGRDALFGSGSASALAALNFISARKAGDDAAQQVLNRQ